MTDYYIRIYKYTHDGDPDYEKIDQVNLMVKKNDKRTEKEIIINMLENLLESYKEEVKRGN